MSAPFKILVDRLKNEKEQKVCEEVTSSFLGIDEPGLRYEGSLQVQGMAAMHYQEIILNLEMNALAILPCSICNKDVEKKVRAEQVVAFHTDEIKQGTLDYSEVIRDMILLETPKFAECNDNCSKRKEIESYLADPKKKSKQTPFKHLKMDQLEN
jgi:uncharacterized metal-binding protein YceD (DUF177 family)